MRLAAGLAAALLAAAAVSYLAAYTALGDPLAGLGPGGWGVEGGAAERLRSLAGGAGGALEGFARWLRGLAVGELGYSLSYGAPVARLVARGLAYTLAAVAPAAVAAAASGLAAGPLLLRRPRLAVVVEAAAQLPGFAYAAAAAAAAVAGLLPPGLGWRLAAYAASVYAALAPRMAVASLGLLRSAAVDAAASLAAARAVGMPPRWRVGVLRRMVAPQYLLYASAAAAGVLERSIVLEPLLGYPGLGMLAARAIVEADPALAAAALLASAAPVAALHAAAEALQGRLAPWSLRGAAP